MSACVFLNVHVNFVSQTYLMNVFFMSLDNNITRTLFLFLIWQLAIMFHLFGCFTSREKGTIFELFDILFAYALPAPSLENSEV